MGKRIFLTKDEARHIANNLSVAYHDHGRHVGLNVKIYSGNFPGVTDVLWDAYLATGVIENFFGTLIGDLWENVEERFRDATGLQLYAAGRSGGYWGFSRYEAERAGLSESQCLKALGKAIAEALYANLGHSKVRLVDVGIDLTHDGEHYAHVEIWKDIKRNYEITLEGPEVWRKLESKFQEKLTSTKHDADFHEVFREIWKAMHQLKNAYQYAERLREVDPNLVIIDRSNNQVFVPSL